MGKSKYVYVVYGIEQGFIKDFKRLKDAKSFIKNDLIPFDIEQEIQDKYIIIKEFVSLS